MLFAFSVILSHINLLYFHKIVKILKIPKKACRADWNP